MSNSSPSVSPALQRTGWLILIIIGLTTLLYFGKVFWLPVVFGGLLGMLFLPLIRRLRRWGWPDWLAIITCVVVLLLLLALLMGTVTYQVNAVVQQWPQVQEELLQKGEQLRQFAIQDLGLSANRLDSIRERIAQSGESFQSVAGNFVGSFFSSSTQVLLTLVYMFFLLLSRQRLYEFVLMLVGEDQRPVAEGSIQAALQVVVNYLGGRLILMAILGGFYAIGFWAFGLPNALPLAVLAGALSIIPYVGNIIGAAIAIAFGIATGEDLIPLLGVIGTMSVAQVLENNVLQPWIIGNRVSMNPLFTFTAVIAFGLLWGVPGTIVAIPMVGIFKQVCHRVPSLKPLGYVMDLKEEEGGELQQN